ncbi:MAG: MFS transporter [Desulfovibrionaceae bacterium]
MIPRGLIWRIGLSQLIGWGVTYYAMGVFGEYMSAEFGWGRTLVYGGFSAALVVMGLVSPLVGRCIDRWGGRMVMTVGSLLAALGCAGIAASHGMPAYYASWACLGLAMRAMLYDAAFAALTRIGGAEARRPMAQITLLGGLASTCLWPLGHALAEALGWRGALLAYAGLALATVPLHLTLPTGRAPAPDAPATGDASPLHAPRHVHRLNSVLYALIIALATGLSSAMSAHVIGLLQGLGLTVALAVSMATLLGIGQSLARLSVVLFRSRAHPVNLTLAATMVLPVCFMVGLDTDTAPLAAVFVFTYGVGNGILSITRGTLPLVLFDLAGYGTLVGKLLVPSFFVCAASPLVFARVIEQYGARGALTVALCAASIILAAACALKALSRRHAARI